MTYEECMLAIFANPEHDAPRRALAQFLRPTDPRQSEFIELQLEMAIRRRETRYKPGVATVGGKSIREDHLESEYGNQWSRDLDMYMGELPIHRIVEFDRGLVRLCSMNPYLFLEQGEYIMSRIAPLRGIAFYDDPEGDPFPMKQLAASPLLARLDEIRFKDCRLSDDEIEIFATSTHLARCQNIDLRVDSYPGTTLRTVEALAANPEIRKCVNIQYRARASDRGLVGEFEYNEDSGYSRSSYYEMSAEGRDLERKYGYIPWLHLGNSPWDPADALYWVEQKVLPLFVPGSPAVAPTPHGSGISKLHTLMPRRKSYE